MNKLSSMEKDTIWYSRKTKEYIKIVERKCFNHHSEASKYLNVNNNEDFLKDTYQLIDFNGELVKYSCFINVTDVMFNENETRNGIYFPQQLILILDLIHIK